MVSVGVGCDRELEVPVVSVDIGCDRELEVPVVSVGVGCDREPVVSVDTLAATKSSRCRWSQLTLAATMWAVRAECVSGCGDKSSHASSCQQALPKFWFASCIDSSL